MSFLEWWGESADPGKVGRLEIGEEHEVCRWKPLVLVRFVFVVAFLPTAWYFGIKAVPLPFWESAGLVIGGTMIYVAVAYLITPEANFENLGWAGGLIDHPWRYSHDLNRSLISLGLLLAPGKFLAESVLDMIVLLCPPADDFSADESQEF